MRMRRQSVVALVVVVLFVAVFGALGVLEQRDRPDKAAEGRGDSIAVRADSHRLQEAPDGAPVFVEFLDFECEGCRAAYPYVEQLRKDYAGKVEFVIRYMPMPGHFNAMNAAVAVEAAARQGKLEPMYQRMYETQAEWGEQQVSKAALFREFAADLGLDMAQYDADVDSQEVADRVRKDFNDAIALGAQGTPSFFVGGKPIAVTQASDLDRAITAALDKAPLS